ncbi:MAG: murein hydrolase activator EnvC family protein [Bacteroidota bacterium]
MINRIIFLVLLSITSLAVTAQSVDDLRRRKQQAADEIRITNDLLTRVSQDQKVTLNRLQLLNRQINQRNELISSMSSEVSLLQQIIDDNTLVVNMLTEDIEQIRKEYARLIQIAYKNRMSYDKILFFLSADNFNQAYRRLLYLRQYTSHRQKQAETISSLQSLLRKKIVDLENQKRTRETLLNQQVVESKKLEGEKRQQNTLSQQLQNQQKELRNKLAQQRRVEQQLEQEIQRIIEEEARKTSTPAAQGFALTPEQKLIGDSFEQNRRRLPWPVERGVITEKFGVHPHPVLRNVTVNNNGVNIATDAGAKARAVFNGEVSRVFGITGGNMAVIVRHGQYLTVYSNLIDVTVKKGDKVNVRQNLGTVYADPADGNKAILKFQIWKESTKLNPEDWLGR